MVAVLGDLDDVELDRLLGEHEASVVGGGVGDHAAVAGAALEVKAARALLFEQPLGELGVRLGDHVAVLVLADRQQPVHVLDVLHRHPGGGGDRLVVLAEHLALSHVPAHRRKAPQHAR